MAIIMRKGLKINFDPNKMQAGELAVVTDARELHATFAPGDSPEVLLAPETDGTEGQVLALEDGEPTWKSVASPTDAQVDEAVSDWLDEHPEATTTVQDGAITYAKLDSNLKGTVDDVGELKSELKESEIVIEQNTDFNSTDGYLVSAETGELISNPAGRYTIIDLTQKKYLTLTFKVTAFGVNAGYGFVLADNTWSGVHTTTNTTVTVNVPDGAKTFKLCWNWSNLSTQVITEKVCLLVKTSIDAVNAKLQASGQMAFDKYRGYGVSSETGELVSNAACSYTIIDLTGKTFISLTFKVTSFGANLGYGLVLSDDSWFGVHTTTNTTVTITIPNGAKSFKLCWNWSNLLDTNQSVSGTWYETTGNLLDAINSADIDNKIGYPIYIDTSIDITSSAPVITPTYDCDTDIYARYDALVSSYPNWVEKIDTSDADSEIGMEKPSYLDGLSIYMYKFSAKRTNMTDNANRLRVMITTATHPMEMLSIFSILYFFQWINDNWKTNETALQLRTMVDFYVIPCLCPLGYNNVLRTNRPVADGGVNINRNFPTTDWTVSGSGTADYSGATAGSEYETKLIMYYANQIKPHIYFDAHAGSMPNGRYGCIELGGNAKTYVIDCAMSYAMGLIQNWIANNSDFPQYIDNNPLFNVNVGNAYIGSAYRWFEEKITDFAFLTEESIDNYWVNGVLTTTNPETGTERIYNENFHAVYGALVWFIYTASRFFKS